eukprot:759433-Hanusia_phi.AAC.3
MASAFIGVKHGKIKTRPKGIREDMLLSLPSGEDNRLFLDINVQRKAMSNLGATWQGRRMIVTEDYICFGKLTGNDMLDYIPLVEVETISRKSSVHAEGVISMLSHAPSIGMKKNSKQQTGFFRVASHDAAVDEEEEGLNVFAILTTENGHNSGRSTVLALEERKEYERVTSILEACVRDRKQLEIDKIDDTFMKKCQHRARNFYDGMFCQSIVGLLIVASYVNALVNAQMLPDSETSSVRVFTAMEWFFNISFTIVRLRCVKGGLVTTAAGSAR